MDEKMMLALVTMDVPADESTVYPLLRGIAQVCADEPADWETIVSGVIGFDASLGNVVESFRRRMDELSAGPDAVNEVVRELRDADGLLAEFQARRAAYIKATWANLVEVYGNWIEWDFDTDTGEAWLNNLLEHAASDHGGPDGPIYTTAYNRLLPAYGTPRDTMITTLRQLGFTIPNPSAEPATGAEPSGEAAVVLTPEQHDAAVEVAESISTDITDALPGLAEELGMSTDELMAQLAQIPQQEIEAEIAQGLAG